VGVQSFLIFLDSRSPIKAFEDKLRENDVKRIKSHLPTYSLILFFCFYLIAWKTVGLVWAKDDTILKFQERQQGLKSIQARYEREIVPQAGSGEGSSWERGKAQGTLLFQKPDRISLQQSKPHRESLLTNGETVWWVQYEEKIVHTYPLKNFLGQVKPILEFLSVIAKLQTSYQVASTPGDSSASGTQYAYILTPRTPRQELKRINIKIDKETYLLSEFGIESFLGEVTRFKLSQIEENPEFPKGTFEFKIPKGFTVQNN